MKVKKMKVLITQSCPTLCDPMDCVPPGSSVLGISQARIRSGLPFPSPGDFPDPGLKLASFVSPALAGRFSHWKVKVKSLSHVQLLPTPWTAAHQAPPSMYFPGKSTGVGCHCLLQNVP